MRTFYIKKMKDTEDRIITETAVCTFQFARGIHLNITAYVVVNAGNQGSERIGGKINMMVNHNPVRNAGHLTKIF